MRLLQIIFISLLLTSCASYTTIRSKIGYQSKLEGDFKVVIVPPAAEVHTVEFGGKRERMYEYERHIEHVIAHKLTAQLKHRGFNAQIMSRKDIIQANLVKDITILRNQYDARLTDLYKTEIIEIEKAQNTNVNLGKFAIDFGKKTNSSLIFMVNYHQQSETNGLKAASFVLNVAAVALGGQSQEHNNDFATISIGVIDAQSGDLLWANIAKIYGASVNGSGFFTSAEEADNDKINLLVKNCMEQLNKRASS